MHWVKAVCRSLKGGSGLFLKVKVRSDDVMLNVTEQPGVAMDLSSNTRTRAETHGVAWHGRPDVCFFSPNRQGTSCFATIFVAPRRPEIRIRQADVRAGCRAPPGGRFYSVSVPGSSGDVGKGRALAAVTEAEFREAGGSRGIGPGRAGVCARRLLAGDWSGRRAGEVAVAALPGAGAVAGPPGRVDQQPPVPLRPRGPTEAAAAGQRERESRARMASRG